MPELSQTELDKESSVELHKHIAPVHQLQQLQKRIEAKERQWNIEKAQLLQQLEDAREQAQMNAEIEPSLTENQMLKAAQEEMANYRVHKLIEINTLARLLKEALTLAEKYRREAAEAKSEALGNTLELQVLASAFEYAKKEIYDLDATKDELFGEYLSVAEQEAQSKREKELLYQALDSAEKEIQTLRKATTHNHRFNLRNDEEEEDDQPGEVTFGGIMGTSEKRSSPTPSPPLDFNSQTIRTLLSPKPAPLDLTAIDSPQRTNKVTMPALFSELEQATPMGSSLTDELTVHVMQTERNVSRKHSPNSCYTPVDGEDPTTMPEKRKLSGGRTFSIINPSTAMDSLGQSPRLKGDEQPTPYSENHNIKNELPVDESINNPSPSMRANVLDLDHAEDEISTRDRTESILTGVACSPPAPVDYTNGKLRGGDSVGEEALELEIMYNIGKQEEEDFKEKAASSSSEMLAPNGNDQTLYSRRDSFALQPQIDPELESTRSESPHLSSDNDRIGKLPHSRNDTDQLFMEQVNMITSDSNPLQPKFDPELEPSKPGSPSYTPNPVNVSDERKDNTKAPGSTNHARKNTDQILFDDDSTSVRDPKNAFLALMDSSSIGDPFEAVKKSKAVEEEGKHDAPPWNKIDEAETVSVTSDGTDQYDDLTETLNLDPINSSQALLNPELEPDPLPNVLQHKAEESKQVSEIRNLMVNFRRAKKSVAGLNELVGAGNSYQVLLQNPNVRPFSKLLISNQASREDNPSAPESGRESGKQTPNYVETCAERPTPNVEPFPTFSKLKNAGLGCIKESPTNSPSQSQPYDAGSSGPGSEPESPSHSPSSRMVFPGSKLLQIIPNSRCTEKVQQLTLYSKLSYEKLAQLSQSQRRSRLEVQYSLHLLKKNIERLRLDPQSWSEELRKLEEPLRGPINTLLELLSGIGGFDVEVSSPKNFVPKLSQVGEWLFDLQDHLQRYGRRKQDVQLPSQILHHVRDLELELAKSQETLKLTAKAMHIYQIKADVEMKILNAKLGSAEDELKQLSEDVNTSPQVLEPSQKLLDLARDLIQTLQTGIPHGGPVAIRTTTATRVVEDVPLVKAASKRALSEISELRSGTNGKLLTIQTRMLNLDRRVEYLDSLSLGFLAQERWREIKEQLASVWDELKRIKATNQSQVESMLSTIKGNPDSSNEETLETLMGVKRTLSDVGFLTGLDILGLTIESISSEVSAIEVKEIGQDGEKEMDGSIITETDVNFLEEKLRNLLAPRRFKEVLATLTGMKNSFSSMASNTTTLLQHLHESRKVIFKQANSIREVNGKLVKTKESSEKSNSEHIKFREASTRQAQEREKKLEKLEKRKAALEHHLRLCEEKVQNLESQRDRLLAEMAALAGKNEELKKAHEVRYRELHQRFVIEKTTLVERVSDELNRLRTL